MLISQIGSRHADGARSTLFYGPDYTIVTNDRVGGTLVRTMTQHHDSLNRVTLVSKPFSVAQLGAELAAALAEPVPS